MARIGESSCWLFVVLMAMVAGANPPIAGNDKPAEIEIPKAGQPTSDFYNAAGMDVKLAASAVPSELKRDEWLTLTLTISNLLNPDQVRKPSLKALPAFGPFNIEEGAELDPKPDPASRDRRVFVYRLRPASENVSAIPEIAFWYFDPRLKVAPHRPQDRFRKVYSNAVTIRVRPPDKITTATTPLDVPDFALNLATRDKIMAAPSGNPPVWVWLAALAAPPVFAVGWVIVWRRCFPGSAKLVLLKRNRAVRHALAAIARAQKLHPVEAADVLSATMLDYLRERFELPPGAFTPNEIAAHLRATGCPADRIARVQAFFRDCDDCRFAPGHLPAGRIAIDAEQLIIALEEPA